MSTPRIFVTVGTDHHPFDRLVGWIERWAASHHGEVEVFVQHGTSRPPVDTDGAPACTVEEMGERFRSAAVVVCAAGPGTIMDARDAGIRPVVVPRRAGLGEHVDDHQSAFARHAGDTGLVILAASEDAFRAALERALSDPTVYRLNRGQGSEAADAPTKSEPSGVARIGQLIDELVWDG